MESSCSELEASLIKLVKWSPQFERGYDWGKFYSDNSVPPVLCYGTRSTEIERIREKGIVYPGDNHPISKFFSEKISPLLTKLRESPNISYPYKTYHVEYESDVSFPAFYFIGKELLLHAIDNCMKDKFKTCCTFSPGIAWAYANIGGESIKYFHSIGKKLIHNIRNIEYGKFTKEQEEAIAQLEEDIALFEQRRCAGKPALVLIQAPLKKFNKTNLTFFLNKNFFDEMSKGDFCRELRMLNPDNSFAVIPLDDEVVTEKPISPESIVDILY